MTQDEFNDLILDRFEALEKQLKELDAGEIGRERQALARERNLARSERETSANEMSVLADKLNAGRNAIEEQIAEALTRIENSKKLAKSQMELTYDAKAEADAALEQIRALHGEVSTMGGSLIERQDNIVKNIDDRFANFDRASANEYLSELHRNDANKRSSAEISNEIQRQMRLMNPTAFAEPEEQTEG